MTCWQQHPALIVHAVLYVSAAYVRQEVLHHVPWPAAVRELLAARRPLRGARRTTLDRQQEENDLPPAQPGRRTRYRPQMQGIPTSSCGGVGAAGQQRPQLKMALAQGVPEEISPDVLVSEVYHQ